MAKKSISLMRINEYVVDKLLRAALENQGLDGSGKIKLVKIALRHRRVRGSKISVFENRKQGDYKKSVNTPFLAFVKASGKKLAVYRIDTGEIKIISLAQISKKDEVKGTFMLGGITYGKKDTVNGYRRFGIYN